MNTFTCVFETPWFAIEALPAAAGAPYYRLVAPDGVVALALTDVGKLVMVRQFRPALQRETLECPAGGIDAGEGAAQAALREIYEETGYRCDMAIPIGPARFLLNRCAQTDHFVLALGARPDPDWRPREATQPVEVTRAAFADSMRRDTLDHSAAIAGVGLVNVKFDLNFLADAVDVIRARVSRGFVDGSQGDGGRHERDQHGRVRTIVAP